MSMEYASWKFRDRIPKLTVQIQVFCNYPKMEKLKNGTMFNLREDYLYSKGCLFLFIYKKVQISRVTCKL